MRRSAAEEEPDAYLAELASTLDHMVQILANLEDGPALVEAAREDLSVRRPLARVRPEAHLSSYVEILLVVADITEGSESREAAYEAVAAARVLVRDQGREHLLLLGSAFRLQARSLASVSHPAVAFRVYTKAAPKVNLCYPPLTWQTYDVEFTNAIADTSGKKTQNARMTLKHNGVVIHDNLEITGKTGGSRPDPEGTPGPIKLQGHGNPLQFRNIWIVEKK